MAERRIIERPSKASKKERTIVPRSPAPKVFGYLRVSTAEQDTEKNKADIALFANERELGPISWEEEKISGVQDWRKRKLGELLLEKTKKGDTIITPELSRLGRSTLQILDFMKEAKERGVNVYAVKGGWSLDDSMSGKIVLTVMAMVSEIERDLISARTKEGLAALRAKGGRLGRPRGPGKSKLDQYRPEIEALLANGSSKTFIAERYGCSPSTLKNWLDKNQINVVPKP